MQATPPQETALGECQPAALFELLWATIAELMGVPATATIVRRATHRLESRRPNLAKLAISKQRYTFVYSLPPAWSHASDESLAELRELAREICRVLSALTGEIVIRRLERVEALRRCHLCDDWSRS